MVEDNMEDIDTAFSEYREKAQEVLESFASPSQVQQSHSNNIRRHSQIPQEYVDAACGVQRNGTPEHIIPQHTTENKGPAHILGVAEKGPPHLLEVVDSVVDVECVKGWATCVVECVEDRRSEGNEMDAPACVRNCLNALLLMFGIVLFMALVGALIYSSRMRPTFHYFAHFVHSGDKYFIHF